MSQPELGYSTPNGDRNPIVTCSSEESAILGRYYGELFHSSEFADALTGFIDESMGKKPVTGIILSVIPKQRHLDITVLSDFDGRPEQREEYEKVKEAFGNLFRVTRTEIENVGMSLAWGDASRLNERAYEQIRRGYAEGRVTDPWQAIDPEVRSFVSIIHK